jgi:hypothetical protein
VDLTVLSSELIESPFCPALVQELEKALEIETRAWPANEALAAQGEGQRVRVMGTDVLDVIDGGRPREEDGREERVRTWAWDTVSGCGAHAGSDVSTMLGGGRG